VRESKSIPQEKPVRGELLSVADAAKKIQKSRRWVYNHMEDGTLPFPWFMLCTKKRFIDSADIEDYRRENGERK
jgi:predicted DNA-binding transcriptional regulator AlpA